MCRNYSDMHNVGLITVASWTKAFTPFYISSTGIVYSNPLFTWIIYECVCVFSVFVDSTFRRADSSSLSPIRCPWNKINEPDKQERPGRCFAMTLWQWLGDKFSWEIIWSLFPQNGHQGALTWQGKEKGDV